MNHMKARPVHRRSERSIISIKLTAQAFADLIGARVFPVLEKTPVPTGDGLFKFKLGAHRDTNQIDQYLWDQATGYGVVLDNHTVADDDGKLPEYWKSATLQVKTAKGTHYYYAGRTPASAHEGYDIKSGRGAYVVGPGSLHPSGVTYEQLNDYTPQPCPTPPKEDRKFWGTIPDLSKGERVWEGIRDWALFKYACYLTDYEITQQDFVDKMVAANLLCDPKFSADHDLKKKIEVFLRRFEDKFVDEYNGFQYIDLGKPHPHSTTLFAGKLLPSSYTVLSAQDGVGKSFLSITLGMAVATNNSIISGIPVTTPPEYRGVLYFGERYEEDVPRIQTLAACYDVNLLPDVYPFAKENVPFAFSNGSMKKDKGTPFLLHEPSGQALLRRELQQIKQHQEKPLALLIVDTFTAFCAGVDENSTSVMATLSLFLRSLHADDLVHTILILAHEPKASKIHSEYVGMRGSGTIQQGSKQAGRIIKYEDSKLVLEWSPSELKTTLRKHPDYEKVYFKINPLSEDQAFLTRISKKEAIDLVMDKKAKYPGWVAAFDASYPGRQFTAAEAGAVIGCSPPSARKYLLLMIAEGLIAEHKINKKQTKYSTIPKGVVL